MNVLKNENPHFLVVLNGSFFFASDLLRQLKFDAEVSFIKLKSYEGIKKCWNSYRNIWTVNKHQ